MKSFFNILLRRLGTVLFISLMLLFITAIVLTTCKVSGGLFFVVLLGFVFLHTYFTHEFLDENTLPGERVYFFLVDEPDDILFGVVKSKGTHAAIIRMKDGRMVAASYREQLHHGRKKYSS